MKKQKPWLDIPESRFKRPEILADPPILRQLFYINPRTILGDSWWQAERKLAIAANNECCWACGIHPRTEGRYRKYLECHERYEQEVYWGGKPNHSYVRVTLKEVVALCNACHSFIHRGRLEFLGHKRKYHSVFNRGRRILKRERVPLTYEHPKIRIIPFVFLEIEGKKYNIDFPRGFDEVGICRICDNMGAIFGGLCYNDSKLTNKKG